MPKKVQKPCTIRNEKKKDIFEQFRPRKGIKYQLSQTETDMKAGVTKIHYKHTAIEFEPGQDLTLEIQDSAVVKEYDKQRGRGPVYKFYEEVGESKSLRRYLCKSTTAIQMFLEQEDFQIRAEKRVHDKIIKLIGPEWYQELSNKQFECVDTLQDALLKDHKCNSIVNTQDVLAELGLVLRPNHTKVQYALKNFFLCPVEYLLMLYKLCKTQYNTYTLNDKLILSAVVHLTMRDTLKEMHLRTPSPPRKPKAKQKPAEKKPSKKPVSPYLEAFPYIPQKYKHGIYTNTHRQYPNLRYFNYINDMYDVDFKIQQPKIRKPVDTNSKYGKPPIIPVRQLRSRVIRMKTLELKKPSLYTNKFCDQVSFSNSASGIHTGKKSNLETEFTSKKENDRISQAHKLNNSEIKINEEESISDDAIAGDNDIINIYTNCYAYKNEDGIINDDITCICSKDNVLQSNKSITQRVEENMKLVSAYDHPRNNSHTSCICSASSEDKKEQFIYVNGKKLNLCSCDSINIKYSLNIDCDTTNACACLISNDNNKNNTECKVCLCTESEKNNNKDQISTEVPVKIVDKNNSKTEGMTENIEQTNNDNSENVEETNRSEEEAEMEEEAEVEEEKGACEKLFDKYLVEHDDCLWMYELYQDKIQFETDAYMKDRFETCSCVHSEESFQKKINKPNIINRCKVETGRRKNGQGSNVEQTESNRIDVKETKSSTCKESKKKLEGRYVCDEQIVCGEQPCNEENVAEKLDQDKDKKINEKPNVVTEEEDKVDPRIYTFDEFPKKRKAQLKLLKRLLSDLAKDGYPLTLLPQCHLLPHFKIWLDKRSSKNISMDERDSLFEVSKEYWKHIERCHIKMPQPSLPVTNKHMRQMTWGSVEKHREMIAKTRTKYYRSEKQKFINSAQEFYVTTQHYDLPNKTFRNCLFAYLPSDENHVFPFKPWQMHEYRDMSKSCC